MEGRTSASPTAEKPAGAIAASETRERGSIVGGPSEGALSTRHTGEEVHSVIDHATERIEPRVDDIRQAVKDRVSKSGNFIAQQVSQLREKSREFFSTPNRKYAAIGATALAFTGLRRLRQHRQVETQTNLEKLKSHLPEQLTSRMG